MISGSKRWNIVKCKILSLAGRKFSHISISDHIRYIDPESISGLFSRLSKIFIAFNLHESPITVCAVAQHCYNGDVSFLWEKWKL